MTTETTQPKPLFAKLAAVLGQIKRVEKAGRNKHFSYNYAANEDVLDTIRPLLVENGIAFFASMIDCTQQTEQTSKGDPTTRTHVVLELTFADTESGEVIKTHWHGEALDSGDKGIQKAATSAKKYFLLSTFLVSTGDSHEDTDAESIEAARPVSNRKPKPNVSDVPWVKDKTRVEKFFEWSASHPFNMDFRDTMIALQNTLPEGALLEIGEYPGSREEAMAAVIAASAHYDFAAIDTVMDESLKAMSLDSLSVIRNLAHKIQSPPEPPTEIDTEAVRESLGNNGNRRVGGGDDGRKRKSKPSLDAAPEDAPVPEDSIAF